MRRTMVTVAVLFVLSVTGLGQQPAPAFDVVSIKRNASSELGMRPRQEPGREIFENISIDYLIRQAFSVNYQRLLNVPDWAKNDRYDILATYAATNPAGPMRRDLVRQMIQRLLEERFALRAHRETRQLPVYALERLDATKLGPGLRPSTVDCSKRDQNGRSPCSTRIAPGLIDATGAAWGFLPTNIGITDRPVIDKTGLSGPVDVKLEWNATTISGSSDPGLPAASDKVSIFTALQEQLGLRLRTTTESLEVVVVDQIERPTEN